MLKKTHFITLVQKIITYLSFFLETIIDNIFKLLDLFFANTTQLISELSVFIDEFLNHIHLLIQLSELGICEDLCV